MKNLTSALSLVAAFALTSGATTSRAADYQIFYIAESGDYTVADGDVNVVNGVATSGDLQIFTGPDIGNYDLVAGSGTASGLSYDSQVSPDAFGFLDADGLLWSPNGKTSGAPLLDMAFNSSAKGGAPGDTFSIDGPAVNGALQSYGIATLTPVEVVQNDFIQANSVADGGSTVAMLAAGLGGLMALRRKFAR